MSEFARLVEEFQRSAKVMRSAAGAAGRVVEALSNVADGLMTTFADADRIHAYDVKNGSMLVVHRDGSMRSVRFDDGAAHRIRSKWQAATMKQRGE